MESTDITDSMKDAKELNVDKWTAIYIALLAVFLSVCAIGGDNSAKDATRTNIQASDTWAFYQAKNIRQTNYRLAVDGLELKLAAETNLPAPVRKQIEEKIAAYKADIDHLESDAKKNEGKKELLLKAKELEHERDIALERDPYFDYAQALLQIAIVLASASMVISNRMLIMGSGLLGGGGVLLMVNGFTLAVHIPFIS
jgi:hypothetical protein